MATADEFNTLWAKFQKEKDSDKKDVLLRQIRENVKVRNNNVDEFTTLYTTKKIFISKATPNELVNISHNLESIEKAKRRSEINDKAREKQLSRNKYNVDNQYGKNNKGDAENPVKE